MADDADPTTIPGAATALGRSLIGALPPAFLLLCLINVVFLGVVMWFLNDQVAARTAMVGKLLDRCMEIALHEPPPTH